MNNGASDAERLSLVVERLVRSLRARSSEDPLTQAAAGVMSRLDVDGPSGVTALARAERVSQPAMTQLIARLHDEGLVVREVSPRDRRSVVVTLTDAGRDALEARRALRSERLLEALGRLGAEKRADLSRALPALEELAEATQLRREGPAGPAGSAVPGDR
jgi:DNA-binding MarR family transcriptional regulator